jgi:hypothetical protein
MNWLADNALPIWVGGVVALTLAVVVFLQTRSGKALAAIVAVLVVTAALLVTEQILETPREAVERTLYQLAATVEANDVPGTLAFLASSANPEIRVEIERQMPLVKIERARVLGTPRIEVQGGPDATTATVQCRGLIIATTKQNGMKGAGDDELTITFVRDGDRWLLEDYKSKRNWNHGLGR